MIRCQIKRKIKNQWVFKDYYVYENEDEIRKYKIPVKSIVECQKDDYFYTKNGFYVPAINIAQKLIKDDTLYKFIQTVCNNHWGFYIFQDKLLNATKPIFDRYKKHPERNFLIANDIYFIELLNQKVPLIKAAKTAYNIQYDDKAHKYLNKLFCNEHFMYEFRKRFKMNESLEQKLEQNGINDEYFLQKVKTILDDKTEVPLLRKEALNIITGLWTAKEKEKNHNNKLNSYQINQIETTKDNKALLEENLKSI